MDSEQNLDLIAQKIKIDPPEQRVDLDDPAHAFTVWAGGFFNRMQYCGSRQTLDSAWMLAAAYTHLKALYAVKGPLNAFGVMRFERG